MPTDKNPVEALMQACQRGVAGKGPAIETANNLLAECYGALGKLAAEKEALRKDGERYRWLRQKQLPLDGHDFLSTQETLDRRIDAAMAKEAQP
ncbi:hypothetical protein [Pseudomonas sp.]|uniref:hypothetical protein n=1 Tax=Pseudomonas sp. TaxID=306 RepID=UPI0028B19BB6|nr:hypothetical protein [Pseudomonas sp.]